MNSNRDQSFRVLEVFLASPSDVGIERRVVGSVIEELNRNVAKTVGIRLELVGWETHARPGIGTSAQDVINNQMAPRDIFIAIFWKRFGTPTAVANSGTEEEFDRAYSGWKSVGRPRILVYFKTKPFYPRSQHELEQYQNVLKFRTRVHQSGALTWEFNKAIEFERAIREHLTREIMALSILSLSPIATDAAPSKTVEILVEESTEASQRDTVNLAPSALEFTSGAEVRMVEQIGHDRVAISEHWYSEIPTRSELRSGERMREIGLAVDGIDQRTSFTVQPKSVSVSILRRSIDLNNSAAMDPQKFVLVFTSDSGEMPPRISFGYRTRSRFAYSSSIAECARTFGGSVVVPSLRFDEEALIHFVRVHCERLELDIHTVETTATAPSIRLLTMEENDEGLLSNLTKQNNSTEYHIESWPGAKTMRLVVRNPTRNLAYGIAWKLPLYVEFEKTASSTYRDSDTQLVWSNACSKLLSILHSQILGVYNPNVTPLHEFRDLIARILTSEGITNADFALWISDQPVLSIAEYRRARETGLMRQPLQFASIMTNQESVGDHNSTRLSLYDGTLGIAYATNSLLRYVHAAYDAVSQGDLGESKYPPPFANHRRRELLHSVVSIPMSSERVPEYVAGCLCFYF